MMYCFESCIKSHKTTGVVETYVSTGGVTIKTNSILHSIDVSFDVFQYTVTDEDDTFAEPDESERSNPFTPYTKVNPAPVNLSVPESKSYEIDTDYPTKDKSEEDKGSGGPDYYQDYYSGHAVDPYEINTDCPVKDKGEEDKGSGIDFYKDYYPDSPR